MSDTIAGPTAAPSLDRDDQAWIVLGMLQMAYEFCVSLSGPSCLVAKSP
jgi:hypothetical protein